MTLTFKAFSSILTIPDALDRRQVLKPDGQHFDACWARGVIRDFERMHPQPLSFNYTAQVLLGDKWCECEVEVRRDGTFGLYRNRTY